MVQRHVLQDERLSSCERRKTRYGGIYETQSCRQQHGVEFQQSMTRQLADVGRRVCLTSFWLLLLNEGVDNRVNRLKATSGRALGQMREPYDCYDSLIAKAMKIPSSYSILRLLACSLSSPMYMCSPETCSSSGSHSPGLAVGRERSECMAQ